MSSRPILAAIRFGYGMGPRRAELNPGAILGGLGDGGEVAKKFPVESTATAIAAMARYQRLKKQEKTAPGAPGGRLKQARTDLRRIAGLGLVHGVARILDTPAPFHERLMWFWADHFTAVAKTRVLRAAAPAYLDEAIRPHITGRFSQMLKAVITHPFMLNYLDQVTSMGPNSVAGKRRGKGLNENLAREVMELHSLGVGGGYVQKDVRELAELMTGLSFSRRKQAFVFNPQMAEPGQNRILGKPYGGASHGLKDILLALDDLAAHPSTARHIALKLAVHFVADTPPEGLVDELEATYRRSGGDLMALYEVLLQHPDSWGELGQKAKQPFDFIASALVSLGIAGTQLVAFPPRDLERLLFRPLAAMGQPFMQARGPDGWPEAASAWITPHGLAARISWSNAILRRLGGRVGTAEEFLTTTLGDAAGENLKRAVARAPTDFDGAALVLASAEFNRR